ncbi:MAG: hypothetical protein ABI867_40695 [Kofleriaceae bacterium]
MRWCAVPIVLLAGCAQLAGIEDTSGDGRVGVSLGFERISIGSTIVRAPQDISGNTATYLIEDAADPSGLVRIPAPPSSIDTWSAEIFDATPPVLFDLPDGPDPLPRIFDFPNKAVLGAFAVLEHPDPIPVAPDSLLTVNVALDTAYTSENLLLFTAGSWNQRGLEAPVVGALAVAPPPFQMLSMTSLTGRPHEKITGDDTVLVLRSIGAQLNGFAEIPAFTQTGNDTLTGTMVTVATDRTLDVVIDPTGAAARFAAARPAVPTLSFAWGLRAAPGFELNVDIGPTLHGAGALVTDTAITAAYANPFESHGWRTLFTWSTAATRTFTPVGQALVVTLNSGMFQRDIDPLAGAVMDLPAGLPEVITLDGTPLSTDGTSFATPAQAVEVTFLTDRADATIYQLQLFEIVPNADATALILSIRFAAAGLQRRFVLPPELFVTGSSYTLRAISVAGGFPNVATGDVRARSLPVAVSFLDSGVFTVTP